MSTNTHVRPSLLFCHRLQNSRVISTDECVPSHPTKWTTTYKQRVSGDAYQLKTCRSLSLTGGWHLYTPKITSQIHSLVWIHSHEILISFTHFYLPSLIIYCLQRIPTVIEYGNNRLYLYIDVYEYYGGKWDSLQFGSIILAITMLAQWCLYVWAFIIKYHRSQCRRRGLYAHTPWRYILSIFHPMKIDVILSTTWQWIYD